MQSLVASPVSQSSKAAPKVAQLALRKDGTVGALSSDGYTVYTVRLSPLECTCPGFAHHGRCYHSTQARERFGKRELSQETRTVLALLYPAAQPCEAEEDSELGEREARQALIEAAEYAAWEREQAASGWETEPVDPDALPFE